MTHHASPKQTNQTRTALRLSAKKMRRWLAILLLLLMLGRFVTQTHARMLTNSNAGEGDQRAFLQLGLDLQSHGTLTDGTRSPLYPAFLALFAGRAWRYFTQAKLLSAAFGLLAITALFWLGWQQFNLFTGLVAAYLLSINVEFIVHSATALTESLLVLLFILAWFAMRQALAQPQAAKIWALAGAITGLAYLAKGSGQLLAASFVAVALLLYRLELLRSRGVWLFLGCYVLLASPLWLYNAVQFGNPTFNYAITHQMWMDSWNEWHPNDTANLPTLASYLQTHTIAEIWERQWTGMKALRNILIKTLWPTRTLRVDRFLLSPASGVTLAVLAGLPLIFWRATGRYLTRHGPALYLTGTVGLLFFLLFSWYVPIVALGQRFLLPIVPFIFLLLAHIAGQIGSWLVARGPWFRRGVWLAVAVVALLQLRWAIRTNVEPVHQFLTTSVYHQDRQFNADSATPLAWLANQSPQTEVVAWGPSAGSLPTWAFSDRLAFKLYPPRPQTIPALTGNLVSRDVGFIIVAPDMVSKYPDLLKEQFPGNGSRLEITSFPPGWALTFAYHQMPCDWCIFRLLDNNPPQQPASYRLGQSIELTGFDQYPASLQPGDTLHLTLHWVAHDTVGQDLTVFTQLLGPDYQLHGELDRQPVNNLWPTSRWQPGQPVADRYDIPVDAQAPAGEYLILVGMYNAQTGQRQPVIHNGQPVADNAIRLATMTLE